MTATPADKGPIDWHPWEDSTPEDAYKLGRASRDSEVAELTAKFEEWARIAGARQENLDHSMLRERELSNQVAALKEEVERLKKEKQ